MGNRARLAHLKGAPAVLGKENRKFCTFFYVCLQCMVK